ncbi:MAG: DNA polymerase I [Clostridia bacterium]|nr:DNA polymerase I [Clostridia bacterium]
MKFLILDGNSILNRAFYAIRMLTTKDGRFTNGIYGFMTTFIRLLDTVKPEAVAVAFDLKAPTFRHKMYDGYKAQRKGMPPELAQQLPVLKELLTELGYTIVEKEGFEADDLIGTLSAHNDGCSIATGDRDSLQLVRDGVEVLLTVTKAGQPHTTVYNSEKIKEEFLVEPIRLIDVKALMGDTSDNVPGVAGIGQKTAATLISQFGSVENIYENIDTINIKDSVRSKLIASKDMAFLSKQLVTIVKDAPIETDASAYVPKAPTQRAAALLCELEMFSIVEKLGLDAAAPMACKSVQVQPKEYRENGSLSELIDLILDAKKAFFAIDDDGSMAFDTGKNIDYISTQTNGFKDFQRKIFECAEIEKITDNAKLVYKTALANGYDVQGRVTDVSLQAYLLNPSAPDYDMMRLAREYGVVAVSEDEFSLVCVKASVLPILSEKLSALIANNSMENLLYDIEIPLSQVLADMELLGFEVDAQGIETFGKVLGEEIEKIQNDIYEQAGEEFNLNSPKQLGEVLFVHLGIKPPKKTKTGFSTNAQVLEGLALDYPIVSRILQYRQLAKLKSTYCDGLLKVIASDGRIHSTFNQTETRTGRISSTEPNLQNIPVRSELGSQMRKFFRAKKDCVLVDSDYSQIELRVLADIADDEVMLDAFNNGDDIHLITASQVFNIPPLFVTPEMRGRAKAVNFGIVYGIGAFSLSKDIGVSVAQADKYIKNYLAHYKGVDEYMQRVVEKAKADGYVETKFGRRRYLPELASSNFNLRSFGERVARNMPIQGTAADIMKIAMIKVYRRLKAEGLKARLIMQVHDELIVEAPESEALKVREILTQEMENAAQMKVKLEAQANIGKTWHEAKG